MLALTLALPALADPQIWTVDDDGPADFAEVSDAIAAASPGDTLWVEPGLYGPAVLDKELTVIGSRDEKPFVIGLFEVTGVETFTLCGLRFGDLEVDGVTGRGRVDDCSIPDGSFLVRDCDELLVSRTEALGKDEFDFDGANGVDVCTSRVVFTDCVLEGGDGQSDPIFPTAGWEGLSVGTLCGPAEVWLSGCAVRGGAGGFGFGSEPGGNGVLAFDGTVNVRGSSVHTIAGGPGVPPGLALFGSDETITYSGVQVDGGVFGAVEVTPAEPYLTVGGDDAPGAARRIRVHGPAVTLAVVGLSTAPALLSIPGWDGLLWLDPAQVAVTFPLTLQGQDVASTVLLPLPADSSLAGLTGEVQGAVAMPGGTQLWTPPSQIVLRF